MVPFSFGREGRRDRRVFSPLRACASVSRSQKNPVRPGSLPSPFSLLFCQHARVKAGPSFSFLSVTPAAFPLFLPPPPKIFWEGGERDHFFPHNPVVNPSSFFFPPHAIFMIGMFRLFSSSLRAPSPPLLAYVQKVNFCRISLEKKLGLEEKKIPNAALQAGVTPPLPFLFFFLCNWIKGARSILSLYYVLVGGLGFPYGFFSEGNPFFPPHLIWCERKGKELRLRSSLQGVRSETLPPLLLHDRQFFPSPDPPLPFPLLVENWMRKTPPPPNLTPPPLPGAAKVPRLGFFPFPFFFLFTVGIRIIPDPP